MSYSINSNFNLRKNYGLYRDLTSFYKREHTDSNTLSQADSKALKRAIIEVSRHPYSNKLDPTETTGPVKEYDKKLKAFIDTYNLTLDSSSKSKNSSIKKISDKMKEIVKKHKDTLSSLGISFDKNGFIKMSSSIKMKTTKEYEKVFGNNSSFIKELSKIPGLINNHIDTTA